MTGTLLFLARNWRSSKNKKSGNWRIIKGKERRTKKKKKEEEEEEAKAMKEKSSGKE